MGLYQVEIGTLNHAVETKVAILDEGIDRLGRDGRLEAHREKTLRLLVREREQAVKEAE